MFKLDVIKGDKDNIGPWHFTLFPYEFSIKFPFKICVALFTTLPLEFATGAAVELTSAKLGVIDCPLNNIIVKRLR